MSGSLSGVQIEAGPITGYENYIKPTIFIKNSNDLYEEFSEEEPIQKQYDFKGASFKVIKKGRNVMVTFSGSITEELTTSTFYDVQLDSIFKPMVEVNDTFAVSNNELGMFRITTAGLLRVYPWVNMPATRAMRYTVNYISAN